MLEVPGRAGLIQPEPARGSAATCRTPAGPFGAGGPRSAPAGRHQQRPHPAVDARCMDLPRTVALDKPASSDLVDVRAWCMVIRTGSRA